MLLALSNVRNSLHFLPHIKKVPSENTELSTHFWEQVTLVLAVKTVLLVLQPLRKILHIQFISVTSFGVPLASLLSLHSIILQTQCTKDKHSWKPLSPKHVQCFLFHVVSLCRVPLTLLHQETTSWYVPPEWGDRPQGRISPPPLPQPTRPCESNPWSLTTSTTSMYPWSLCALSTLTPPHHLTQVMVRSSDWSSAWV